MPKTIVTRPNVSLSQDRYELVLTPTKAIAQTLNMPHRSLESVAETVVNKQGMRVASGLLSRRLLQNAITTELKVKDVAGITALWNPVIKELLSNGCDLLFLAKHSFPRVANLGKVALSYQAQLRKLNCLDRSELFWQAAQLNEVFQSCFIYGYFTPNLSQLAFINAFAADKSCLILPLEKQYFFANNQRCFDWLCDRGWQLEANNEKLVVSSLKRDLQQWYTEKDHSPEGLKFHNYPNIRDEVRGVLAQVKLLLQQKIKANEIILIAKDVKLYGNTLLDIAWEYEVPLRASYDVPLSNTRLGFCLQLLLEVISTLNSSRKLDFANTSKLLAHPLVSKIDREIWQQARISCPQTINDWQAIGIDLTCLQLPTVANSLQWQELYKQIIEFLDISQKVKPWAQEILAYYKFQDVLEELFVNTQKTFTKTEFFSELQELINNLTVPVQPGKGGVELHCPESLFGSQYQYVFVLGMAENMFPAAIKEDLILNYRDRKHLKQQNINLNTIVSQTRQAELSFYFLLQIPTKQITFSYPQLIGKQPNYPSPYLTNLPATPNKNEYLVSPEEIKQFYLRQPEKITNINKVISPEELSLIKHKWQIALERNNNLKNEYNGFVKIPLDSNKFTFSASQLTQIGQCPFKWFTARILKLREIPETKLTLENKTRGSLYHKCLELYLAEVNTAADLEKFNSQQLEQAFQTAVTKLQIPELILRSQEKQELLTLLEINLTTPDFFTSDSHIIEREKEFQTEWHGLKIKGTIDRLDRTTTGIKVIDYKTSSTAPLGIKDESGKANIDLQIPLYTYAMSREYPEDKVEAVYYSLSKCKPIRRNKSNPEQLASFAERVKNYLTEGNYPIAPDTQYKACNYCQFDLVCRINK